MTLKLRLNRIVFWWYYRLVDSHFKQYPIIKSIKLLRSHYEHEAEYNRNLSRVIRENIHEVDEWRKKYFDLKMQMTANPGQIDQLNKMFGTDYTNPDQN